MKTKEVIEMLQKADPSGELECVVGNFPIISAAVLPAYWDGCLQILHRNPGYTFHAAEYVSGDWKCSIRACPIEDALLDNPDLPVKYDGEYTEKHYKNYVEEERQRVKGIHDSVEKNHFVSYMQRRFSIQEIEGLQELSNKFYDDNLSFTDSFEKEIIETGNNSHYGYRELQWDKDITLLIENGKPIIKFTNGLPVWSKKVK